jgi:hypothetical protein
MRDRVQGWNSSRRQPLPLTGGADAGQYAGPPPLRKLYLADELRFTRDPFDALIVSAARSLDLPLLTRDGAIRESGTIRVIW